MCIDDGIDDITVNSNQSFQISKDGDEKFKTSGLFLSNE
jgi:hypothetical protein